MVYQVHLTKSVVLRPLKSKRTAEVPMQILDIFLLFGAPTFYRVIMAMNLLRVLFLNYKIYDHAEYKIVNGKPRHS